MTAYVALLRGINVGRAKQVAMSDLRSIVEDLGFGDVQTLLRSGNVVFSGAKADPTAIAGRLEAALEARLGMTIGVVVRTGDELAAVMEANPIPEAAGDGAALHVMFLGAPLSAGEQAALESAEFDPEVVRLAEREVYVWYPNGMGRSKTAERLGKLIKTLATDRNWNTVGKLRRMASGI